MTIGAAGPADVEAVIDLIVAEQVRPERHIPYLGEERAGIVAELAELDTPWTSFLHIVRVDGDLVGAAFADVDEELGKAWIHGPWIAGEDDDRWRRWARPLVEAVIAALPAELTDLELSGDTRNRRLAELGEDMGLEPSEVNWVYTLATARMADWDDADPVAGVRAARADDAHAIEPLHGAEFPDTYLPVERMLAEVVAGDRVALVAPGHDGAIVGYATGQVQPDGAGYVDFVAVDPAGRGRGAGRALVVALVRALAPAVTTGAVHLTVQDRRAPARALYARLGFDVELGLVAYRRR